MVKINEKELKEIFNEIRNNSNSAFEKLYKKYKTLIYGIAFSILKNKQDAEDVVQTVFAKIYDINIDKLPTQKEASWLYTTTKNEAIMLLRKRDNNLSLDSIYEIETSNNEIEEVISKDSYSRLISKLNDKEKEIISLKILANLSFDEIANLLNEPTSTIKWRYYKSIKSLKILLSNLGMFIITLVIGIKTLFNKKITSQESITDNFITEDKVEQDSIQQGTEEENKGFQESITDSTTNRVEDEKQEIIIQQEKVENDVNYLGIGMLSISAIFLVITIIFTILRIKPKLKKGKGEKN